MSETKPEHPAYNSIAIGALNLQSSELGILELTSLALNILQEKVVQQYLQAIKLGSGNPEPANYTG